MASPVYMPPPRRSMFGPIMLIGFGICLLLLTMGKLSPKGAAIAFAKYWPLILIVWGAVKLFEYYRAKSEGLPARGIGAGGVIFLIFFTLMGLSASGIYRSAAYVNLSDLGDLDIDGVPLDELVGKRFEFTQDLTATLPANGSVKVTSERGNIRILPSADDKITVHLRKTVYADNQDEANSRHQGTTPVVRTNGTAVEIDATGGAWQNIRNEFEITVPRKAAVNAMTVRGEVEIRDREGSVEVQSQRGNVTLEAITGNALVHLRRGDMSVRNIKGDVRMEGRGDDINIADVTGVLDLQGDFFGNTSIDRIAKGVRFKSSRTDLEFGKLDGNMVMDSGDLRADGISGPIRVETRSKDIHLENTSGDLHIENQNGEVEIHPDPKMALGNIDIQNRKGSIRITLPSTANFLLDAKATRGDIETDFNIPVNDNDRNARASGTVNKGGPRLQLTTEHATIQVLRSDGSLAREMSEDRDQRKVQDDARRIERDARKTEERAREEAKRIEEKAREVEKNVPKPPDSPKLMQ
jgi:DUF4097 and DUF4098 domain-containing protein YvlB